MNVIALLLLGLIPAIGYAYEMVIKHDPWWAYELDSNSIDSSSYQFFHPYYKEKPKNNYGWNYPKTTTIHKRPMMDFRKVPNVDFNSIPMPNIPAVPAYSTYNKPRKMSEERWRAMNAREWPEWIPPIRMIKLPLDDPPAF